MIYFDNSATTKPNDEVLNSFITVSREFFGNPSSIHNVGGKSERLLSQSRDVIANIFKVKSSEIIFTSGGTESNNLAIKGTAYKHNNRGNHIVTSSIEHPSVLSTCKQLEEQGFNVTYLPVNNEGVISIEDLLEAINEKTILVSLIHVNNEVGSIQPIEEIGKILKNYPKIQFHVDHVQGVGKVPLSLENIDLCSISGHKFHSVKGTGVLLKKEGCSLTPLLAGGQQENYVRSGTENLAGIVSMAKALRLLFENKEQKQKKLFQMKLELKNFIQENLDAYINTPEISAPHILNVSFVGLKPEVIVHALAEKGLYVSTKSACSSKLDSASHVLMEMGLSVERAESGIRISLSSENTLSEVEESKLMLKEVIENLYEVVR